MTLTLSRGRCKSPATKKSRFKRDGGYIFVATLLLLVTVSGVLGLIAECEKAQLRLDKKRVEFFYRQLETNNLSLKMEAKNEID